MDTIPGAPGDERGFCVVAIFGIGAATGNAAANEPIYDTMKL